MTYFSISDNFLTALNTQPPSVVQAGIIVTPSSSFLSNGGSISRTYIKCSVGTCLPINTAASGSFQDMVTSLLLELEALGCEEICESLTCSNKYILIYVI